MTQHFFCNLVLQHSTFNIQHPRTHLITINSIHSTFNIINIINVINYIQKATECDALRTDATAFTTCKDEAKVLTKAVFDAQRTSGDMVDPVKGTSTLHACRSTRADPRGPIHAGCYMRAAPRSVIHAGCFMREAHISYTQY